MRPNPLLLLLCCLPLTGVAGVYKWVAPDGTVHYSDTPREGAEEVHVAPAQTYEPGEPPTFTLSPEPPAPAPAYTRFEVVSPADDLAIRDNTGTLTLEFVLEPELDVDAGHRLVVLLDGQAQPAIQSTSLTLENVDRGTHSVQGQVVDEAGDVLITSPAIKVHLLRHSVLMPHRAPPPKPTKPVTKS
jgi:hypothetical protein